MTGPFAARLFRTAFVLAGGYNLAFGFWSGFFPLQFFELFELAPPRYPSLWACLGMVVGVYGLLYWYAAWKPDRGRAIIAVGLLGKVLGPIGMAFALGQEWPRRVAMLNLYNDIIWWLPFALFLIRDWPLGRRIAAAAPWCCAGLHSIALAVMALALRGGMLTEPDLGRRAAYLAQHPAPGW